MGRLRHLLVVPLVVLAAGCGSDSGETPAPIEVPPDDRDIAFNCMKNADLPVELVGEDEIQVGAADVGPRIVYFQSSGEAEGEQFEGRAEGAEQVGSALVYVNEGADDELETIENCISGD